MIRFSKIFLGFTLILLLLWQLPWCYDFFVAKPSKSAFVLYSPLIGDFVITTSQEGAKGREIVRHDLAGNKYTEEEVDSLLPTFYYRQLMSDERFPDSINGVAVTPRTMQVENFIFKISPSDVNAPRIGLYPLLESMSGRLKLEMPGDVFRINPHGIEFIDMETNKLEKEKSAHFTEVLKKKGFHFPALVIEGNPTTRKDYDEGYVLLDANRQLFHLKQVKGRPYVRAVLLPDTLKLNHLFITEFRNHKTLAFMTDESHSLYALTTAYQIKKVDIPSFDPERESASIIGNMFDWTLRITGLEKETYFAVNAGDYSLLKSMESPSEEVSFAEKAGHYLFPVRLNFTSALDRFVRPRMNE